MHINRWFLHSSLFLYCQLFSYRFITVTKHNTESLKFEMEINAVFAAVALRHNDDLSDSERFIIRDDIVCLFAITGESQTINSVSMGRGQHFTDFFFFFCLSIRPIVAIITFMYATLLKNASKRPSNCSSTHLTMKECSNVC